MERLQIIIALLVSLNSNDAGLNSLVISQLDDFRLYAGATKGLSILIRAARNVLQNPNRSYFFHAPAFYYNAKKILRVLSAVFLEHRNALL